jgi:asparagine synthase (glutamine-hydrolysing)
MGRALAGYGPDASDLGRVGPVHFGRNLARLLPEDAYDGGVLVGGGGSLLLAADLRIDNRSELTEALRISPADARCMSDSDLLLGGLERWGEGVLERLIGDFAFAFYDHRRGRLLLARDPIGQRPLFWHRGRNFFAFASMPNGLHAVPEIPRQPDLDTVARFAAVLPTLGDSSYFRGIQRVEPGHILAVTADGVTSRAYWQPRRGELRLRSFQDYVEAYRETLDNAVASRLRRVDNLVASHLSGGWDSSAVTATAARLLSGGKGDILAYTSVPGNGQEQSAPSNRFADEASLASATAALYPNVRHTLVPNPGGSPVAYLDRTVHLFQRPPFNLCNHDWLAGIRSAARSSGARILLTGEIGNWTISSAPSSLLADYVRQRRWIAWMREALATLSQGRGRVRGVLASSFGPWLPDPVWQAFQRLSSEREPEHALNPDVLARLRGEIDRHRFGPETRPSNYYDRTASGLRQLDYGQYRKGILAGWGIDKRDATADVRLIGLMASLPLEMFLSKGERRPLARAALSDRLPAAVLDERRKGYQAPDWHVGLTRNLADVERLLDRIEADSRASDMIDTDLLRRWMRDLPTTGWDRPEIISRYRTSLLFTLAAGHFIVSSAAPPLPVEHGLG